MKERENEWKPGNAWITLITNEHGSDCQRLPTHYNPSRKQRKIQKEETLKDRHTHHLTHALTAP